MNLFLRQFSELIGDFGYTQAIVLWEKVSPCALQFLQEVQIISLVSCRYAIIFYSTGHAKSMFNYFMFSPTEAYLGGQMPNDVASATSLHPQTINAQEDHQKTLQKYHRLKEQFSKLKEENQRLKAHIEELEDIYEPERRKKRIKRRMEDELLKQHSCPYNLCKKQYASVLALNLHIRSKHDGGTKKDRLAYIKEVLDAQEKGQGLPATKLNIPPEVIQHETRLYTARLQRSLRNSRRLSNASPQDIQPSQKRITSIRHSV